MCIKAGAHMRIKQFANSSRYTHGKLIFHEPEANTGHMVHTIPFMFAQKHNKFRFTAKWYANHLQTAQSMLAVSSTHTRIWFACVHWP